MRKISTILFLTCCTLIAFSQQNNIQKQYNKEGTVSFLKFKNEKAMKNVSEASNLLRDSLKMKTGNIFELQSTKENKTGHTIRSYVQFYKGIKVEHGAYAVHSKNDKIEYIFGNYKDVEEVNISPSLDEKSALKKALSYIKATKYKWEDKTEEENLKQIKNNKSASYFPKGEMVIVKDFLKSNRTYRLAYKFDIYAMLPLSHKVYYIDAINGDLLDTQELIMEVNVNGTAQTRYSGSQSIVGDSYSGGFRLREVRNGVNIQTYNMNLGTNYGSATDFSDNDNDWTSSEYNNTNLDNAALDAHWATEKVYDYFLNTHGRNSYDNFGAPLLNYVHANLVAMGYSNNINAFWDGQRMTYGNGGGFYGPVVSLDVVAHEIGHGVLQHSGTSGGLNYSGESGALNEGLSDIWGACVEAQAAPTKQKWLIGEDLGSPIRSMSNPNAYGDPDTYNGTNWRNPADLTSDNGGVHHNSGVLNHWFYLLTEGGSGTNDISNTYTVNGIGISDAQSIVYKTLNEFIPANYDADFSFMRTATIQAAIDTFGVASCQEINVTNAWYAVGVGAAYQSNLSIAGAPLLCIEQDYTVPNLPSGASVSWNISPATGVATQYTDGNTLFLNGVSDGELTLTATITTTCGIFNITRKIYSGLPPWDGFIAGNSTVVAGDEFEVFVSSEYPATTEYIWYIGTSNGVIHSNGWGSAHGYITEPGEYDIWVEADCDCGQAFLYSTITVFPNDYYRLAVYPNPSHSETTVEYIETEKAKTSGTKTDSFDKHFQVKLYNEKGKVLAEKNNNIKERKVSIDTKDLPDGIYYLHVTEGKETIKKQLIIKH